MLMVARTLCPTRQRSQREISFLPRVAKQQQISTVFAKPTTPTTPTTAHVIMATSPPTSFSTINDRATQISSWLEELPPTPPADEERGLLKRKRATSEPTSVHQFTAMSTHRSVSPSKRQRRDSDDLRPEQSVSAVGSNARPLILGSSTTFSPPGSRVGASTPRRSNSPSRETIAALRVALPPITTELRSHTEFPERDVPTTVCICEPSELFRRPDSKTSNTRKCTQRRRCTRMVRQASSSIS